MPLNTVLQAGMVLLWVHIHLRPQSDKYLCLGKKWQIVAGEEFDDVTRLVGAIGPKLRKFEETSTYLILVASIDSLAILLLQQTVFYSYLIIIN